MFLCDDVQGRMCFDTVSGSYTEAKPGYLMTFMPK